MTIVMLQKTVRVLIVNVAIIDGLDVSGRSFRSKDLFDFMLHQSDSGWRAES